jgi:hypothetical protein
MDVDGYSDTVAVAELFDEFGSACAALTVAVLAIGPPASGPVITSVRVVELLLFSVATEQVIVVVPLHTPAGVAETKVAPAGRTSVTTTPVAVDGPALATTSV